MVAGQTCTGWSTTRRLPLKAVKVAMKLRMKNNIFEFGDMYFLQLIDTAMSASTAVMWPTIYFAFHQAHTVIPKHGKIFFTSAASLTTFTAFGSEIVPTNGTSYVTTSTTLEF